MGCSYCDKRFAQLSNKRNHEQLWHHGDKTNDTKVENGAQNLNYVDGSNSEGTKSKDYIASMSKEPKIVLSSIFDNGVCTLCGVRKFEVDNSMQDHLEQHHNIKMPKYQAKEMDERNLQPFLVVKPTFEQ